MTRAARPWRRGRGAGSFTSPSLADRLLAVTDQGAYAVDMTGRCVFANDAAARLLGTSATLLTGVLVHDEHHGAAVTADGGCPLCAPIRAR
jgi:PAS domain-containing protein